EHFRLFAPQDLFVGNENGLEQIQPGCKVLAVGAKQDRKHNRSFPSTACKYEFMLAPPHTNSPQTSIWRNPTWDARHRVGACPLFTHPPTQTSACLGSRCLDTVNIFCQTVLSIAYITYETQRRQMGLQSVSAGCDREFVRH
uniref:Uncharacterized protein n=1 Tax=Mola mola TaxID=94237 RepID=A0A3Q3W9N4_MOLML